MTAGRRAPSGNAFEPAKQGTPARSLAEGRIEEVRERGGIFVEAVRATRMPMVVTDPSLPGNPIVFANEAFLGVSGYGMDEVLGQGPHFMNGPGTDPADAARFRAALAEDRDEVIETVQYRKDGSRFVASLFLSAFKDADGRTLYQFLSYLDVTHRATAEEELVSRARIEARLRESEARHRLLVGSWAQATWETDGRGVVVADSPSWRAYTGQTLPEWLGYGWLDAIHPDDRAYAERQWRVATAARGLVNAEFRLRAPDGGWRWTNVRASPVLDAEGHVEKWVGMNIDIDARKRAEAALRGSEERLRTLFDSIDEGFTEIEVVMDADGRVVDWRYVALNPAFERLTGLEDVTGRLASEILPDLEPEWAERFAQVVSTGEGVRFELPAAALDRWFDVYVVRIGGDGSRRVAMVYANVTERRRAEDALRRSEEKYRTLFQSIDEGFAVIEFLPADGSRSSDFRFLEVNEAFERHTGNQDVRGKLGSEINPEADAVWIETFDEVARTGEATRFETYHQTTGRWYDVFATRIGGADSRQVGVVFSDTTERRDREERQAFLLRLSDALRAEPTAEAVANRALRMLFEHMRLDRCYVGVYRLAEDTGEFPHQVHDDSLPPLPAQVRLSDFPKALEVAFDRTLVIDDVVETEGLSEGDQASFRALGMRALIAATLRKGEGVPLWAICAISTRPRAWTPGEVALVEEATERTWGAIERVRAEAALRESEERFRQFAEASPDVIWIRDAGTMQFEYVSPAFETIYGADLPELLARNDFEGWAAFIHSEDWERTVAHLLGVRGGERVTHEFRIRRGTDGQVRWIRDTDFPLLDEHGGVQRVAGIGQDITELRAATEALEAEKERFRTLTEGIPQLVWRSCDEGLWTWASPQWLDYTGQSQEESHGRGWLEAVHPDDRDATLRAWEAARPHGMLNVEYRVRRAADGAWRWHQTRSVPVRNGPTAEQPQGRILEWLGTTTDIEDLKRLGEQQAILVAELQHRTRNLLAVVRNVAKRSVPPSSGRDQYDARLAALGRVQGFLARTGRYTVRLHDLVEAELQAAGDGVSDRVTVEGPAIELPGEGAQPVALALHELATNAVKYGAIAQPAGRLSVTWHVEAGEDEPRLLIAWQESGVAMPKGMPKQRGYGSELITRALPYQLKAETRLEFGPDGVRCDIALPAEAFRTVEVAS
ncbi:PAS domain S-box protein [Roseomonas sp. CCTCC AB2023176]|uniref:PAS domain S-box protein n=1 Tax=Roseomonas sp. CCTCC AB2023176 TaxID=3342640 RepID=UPI0035D8B356